MIAEVLALTDIDLVCIDAEHSPFDRSDIDASLMAYRAADKPSVVRTQSGAADQILNALDCGATGVWWCHMLTAWRRPKLLPGQNSMAITAVATPARLVPLTTRAEPIAQNLENNKNNVLIAQIEDLAALEVIDGIAATEGIDCLFIGHDGSNRRARLQFA